MKRKLSFVSVTVAAVAIIALRTHVSAAEDADSANPSPAHALSFSPDGKLLAAAYGWSSQGELIVWQVAERSPKFTVRDAKPIRTVEFSPAGDRLAFGTSSNTVKIVSADTGETLKELVGHSKRVSAVAYSADGKRLASAGADQTVKLWNVETGEVVNQFTCPVKEIPGVAISTDGRWLAAASGQANSAWLWDLTKPDESDRQFSFAGYAARVAFSRDSRYFIVANYGGDMPVFETVSGKEAGCFTNVNSARDVAFSADGRWVAFASVLSDLHVFQWRPPTDDGQQREIRELIGKFASDDMSVRDAASKRLFEVGRAAATQIRAQLESPDPEVRIRCRRLWNRLNDAESAIKFAGYRDGTDCVAFAPNSELIAGGDYSGTIRLWNLTTQKPEATLKHP